MGYMTTFLLAAFVWLAFVIAVVALAVLAVLIRRAYVRRNPGSDVRIQIAKVRLDAERDGVKWNKEEGE